MKNILLTLLIALSSGFSFAVTFTVTVTSDSGPGTFRQAVLDANGSAGVDNIVFDASIDGFPILISSGPCNITESVVIDGNGITNTIIDGTGSSRIIDITTAGVTVWANNVTLRNASTSAVQHSASASMHFDNCLFINNDNGATNGGAISFNGGSSADTLSLNECTLDQNDATANGGAIEFIQGRLIITNSTFSNNIAGANGGAIYFENGSAEIENTTISDNQAMFGGGVYDDIMGLGSYLANCTIANNSGTSEGGGLHSAGSGAGGVSNLSLHNCIIADNTSPSGADVHLNGAFFGSNFNNNVEDCVNASGACPAWSVTADPNLDPSGLQPNGGPTLTIALMAGSPVVDQGLSPFQLTLDQRGELRCPISDMGAFESNPGTPSTSSFSVSVCTEYTVPSGDETYTVSAVVTDTIPNAGGCDSVMTITMTIDPPSTNAFSDVGCGSYTVPSGDETYFADGVYSDTLVAADGCDSILTITVTLQNTTSSFSVTACPSYTVPSGDETYSVIGVYMDTIPNSAGCDSIMTINVSAVGAPSTSSFTAFDCETYTVPSGDETYTTSGVYNDTIPNASGCDSVMTITVDIGNTTSTLNLDECISYTTPSGSQTYSVAGTYSTMDTIPNAAGCDSIITINLDLTVPNFGMVVNNGIYSSLATGVTYQWIDCNTMTDIPGETGSTFTPTVNGTYAVVVTENGCVDTSACIAINDVGLVDADLSSMIKLYPNPSDGQFNIVLPMEFKQLELRVLNVVGEIVAEESLTDVHTVNQTLNVEPGLYIIELRTNDGRLAKVNVIIE